MKRSYEYLQDKAIKPFQKRMRKDTLFILSNLYDDLQDQNFIINKKIKSRILDLQREHLKQEARNGNNSCKPITCKYIESFCVEYFNAKYQTETVRKDSGIYGIFVDDELKYIGKTFRSFNQRFLQHKRKLEEGSQDQYLYRKLIKDKEKGKSIILKPLIVLGNVTFKNKKGMKLEISQKELSGMQYALIYMLKPEYNIQGNLKEYIYTV